LTSELAAQVIRLAVAAAAWQDVVTVAAVKNKTFGGSIMAAGLLTVNDFLQHLQEQLPAAPARPDLILLPPIAFDATGLDLFGRSALEIEAATGIKTVIPC